MNDVALLSIRDAELLSDDHLDKPGLVIEPVELGLQLRCKVILHPAIQRWFELSFIRDYLSLLVVSQTNGIELFDDLLRRAVLLDPAFGIEAHHVTGVDLSSQLEELSKALLLSLCEPTGSHGDHKVDVSVIVVLFVVLCINVNKSCVNLVHELP